LVVLLGAMIWLLQSHCAVVERSAPRGEQHARPPEGSERPPVALERAEDGVPIMTSTSRAAMPGGPLHPHPITPAHERIYRENNLVGALNAAVDRQDARRIREVLARYAAEYPEDAHRLQEGYAIIAACLEQLDDETRERAQRFWSTEIRSQTRRYVRRYCLERDRAS
jgi:hypothetical protein